MKRAFTLLLPLLAMAPAFSQISRPETGRKFPSFIQPADAPATILSNDLFTLHFGLRPTDEMRPKEQTSDHLGFTHTRYQQYYRGVKVDGAVYTVHSRQGVIALMSGNFRSVGELDVRPRLSQSNAFSRALRHVAADRYLWQDPGYSGRLNDYDPFQGDLVIVADPLGKDPARLAYKFDVYAIVPLYRAFVYVDAHTGAVIREDHRIHTTDVPATGLSLYDGNVSFTADYTGVNYRLRQRKDGDGVESYSMNNGTNYAAAQDIVSPGAYFTQDRTAVQAHWGAEKTHQYFRQRHNRNSVDGAGAILRSFVHYSTSYVNAFWDGSRVTYGDGNGTTYGPLVSVDIAGHEIAHGVTQYSAGLIYRNESGALNESFSDIFGEAIERFATGANDWYVGADIDLVDGNGIRSLRDPNLFGHPDTYGGLYWYTGSGDNGGVHTNSGVQNKWFYILSAGESGVNDKGKSYQVAGIGMEKAAAIAYRNLTVYLSSSSTYNDARQGAIQAARDLYGDASPEEIATTNAWYAVGVGNPYDGNDDYCQSGGVNADFEWIAEISVGAFSNSSGSAGYTDFTNKTINLTPGQTYPLRLTPGFSSTAWSEYWRIWIDYNGDADFADPGELVFDAGGLSKTTVTGNLTIAAGAGGTTRMRIAMKWENVPSYCESFNYGEVEDYTVSFSGTPSDTQKPTPPGNLTAFNTTSTGASLSWSPSSDNVGVTGYRVYVNGLFQGSTSATSFTVSGLSPATTYTLSVRAADAAGNLSDPSAIQVTTPAGPDTQKPSPPGNLTAFNTTSTGVSLSWSPSSDNVGVTGYRVYVNSVFQGSTSATSFTVSGLSPATTYNLSVRAADAAGNLSDPSAIQMTTTAGPDTQKPSPPNNLTAFNTTSTQTTLSWTASFDNVGVTGYRVYVNNVFHGSTSTTSYLVSGLYPMTTYSMSVRAADAAGNLSDPSTISVKTLSGGIIIFGLKQAEPSSPEEIMLYPNPSRDFLVIRGIDQTTVRALRLYHSDGRLMSAFNLEFNGEPVDVSGLKAGVYFLRIDLEGTSLTRSFIKQ